MGVVLKELIKKVEHLEVRLIAGADGLFNEVSWAHMVDSIAIADFLKGGELAFTTGIGLSPELSLYQLTTHIKNRNASGLVVNLGPYIETIDTEIIDFANKENFPIFIVPWDIHMAEIMRITCAEITKKTQKQIELAVALDNAFYCPNQEELYLPTLLQQGLPMNSAYRILTIKLLADGASAPSARLQWISVRLVNYLHATYPGVVSYSQDKQLVLILEENTLAPTTRFYENLKNWLESQLLVNERSYIGRGRLVTQLTKLYLSYNQARKIAELLTVIELPGSTTWGRQTSLFYENMGICQLLLSLQDRQAMEDYVNNTVYPLYEYDITHKGDLVKVVSTYLRKDCSVKATADALIVHRNTINYKLNKTEEILHKDLSSFECRCELYLGFILQELLHLL